MKRLLGIIMFLGIAFGFAHNALAEKIVILYTGETHADLYPCHCPAAPHGGISRRATKIKELRKIHPNLLLVDSGGFFAAGKLDEYSLNEDLDKQRTLINLKAMQMMGYDAAAVGDEEFNFGRDFLADQIKDSPIGFLSCNVKVAGAKEYLIKEIAGVKTGIFAVTPPVGNINSVEIADPREKIKAVLAELRGKRKADIVILLSHLGEEMDSQLLQQISGIDFVISGHMVGGGEKQSKIKEAVRLSPAWQGRSLGKLEIEIVKGKVKEFTSELIGLAADIPDDKDVGSILPRCFSDKDCWKPGSKGLCENAATSRANCVFKEYAKILFVIVLPKDCLTCHPGPFVATFKHKFPGVEIRMLDVKDKLASQLLKKFKIRLLPAYFAGKAIEKEEGFEAVRKFTEFKDNYYWLFPQFTGVSYIINRPAIPDRLELFINIAGPEAKKVLQTTREFLDRNKGRFDFKLHFVVFEDTDGSLKGRGGVTEIEEDRRVICVEQNLPDKLWDYLICRAGNFNSSWWEDCLNDTQENAQLIKDCAKSDEALKILKQDAALAKELEINYGGLFLLNNKEVFGISDKTTVEELEGLIIKNGRKK